MAGFGFCGAQISDRDAYWLGLQLLGSGNYARIHCELFDQSVSMGWGIKTSLTVIYM